MHWQMQMIFFSMAQQQFSAELLSCLTLGTQCPAQSYRFMNWGYEVMLTQSFKLVSALCCPTLC